MKKANVLIADDEKIVREGLTKYVDWDAYNMRVAATAENGEIALDIIKTQKIDLLITDIYMPNLDGMTLINMLEKMPDAPLVILISGYSDFTYAQTAIRSKIVQDYILKPLDFDRIDIILNQMRDKILTGTSSVQFPVLTEEEWKVYTSTSATVIINTHNKIIEKLERGEVEEAVRQFEDALKICREKNRSLNFISRYCIDLTLNISEFALDNAESISMLGNDPVKEIIKCSTEDALSEYVKNIMYKADEAMKLKEGEKISPIVQAVLKYITENYHDYMLSLNSIAEDYNVSPSYLSNKFKEEAGINFIKYLNSLRIKKAKEFLQDISLKVFMVSDKVGYEDVRYFSRIFRKYTGYTPTEYQKKVTQFTLTD